MAVRNGGQLGLVLRTPDAVVGEDHARMAPTSRLCFVRLDHVHHDGGELLGVHSDS